MRWRLERWPGWALVLVPAFLFLLALELVEPRYFLRDDNALYYLPAYVHDLRAVVEDGELAHLNLFQYQGVPHLARGQTGVLYPPVYLAVALARSAGDVRWAVDILAILHLLAAALGMYWLLRRLGLRQGAVAGGWVLATVPFLVLSTRAWVSFTFGAAFFVWGLFLLLRWYDGPSWRRSLGLAALASLFVATGYPQLVIYSALYQGAFLLALWSLDVAGGRRSEAPALRGAMRLGAALLLALALSAPLLLPMWRAATVSADRAASLPEETFLENSLRPRAFAEAQVFSFQSMEIHSASSSIFHLGLPLLLGWLFAFWPAGAPASGRLREIRLLAVLALLSLIASTEAWSLVYGLPLLSSFRWPFKHFLFLVVLLLPAAAWSFERLRHRSRLAAASLLLVVLASNATIAGVEDFRQSYGFLGIPHPVDEYRETEWSATVDPDTRTFTFHPPGGSLPADLAPRLRVYDFATLFGDRPHFAGYYDPLLSVGAHQTALGSGWGAAPARGGAEGARILRHLGDWGVGVLLAPSDESIRETLRSTGAIEWLQTTENGVDVYRNLAVRPVVEDLADGTSLDHRRETNGFRVRTAGEAKKIRVAVRAVEGWSWQLDGEEKGPPEPHPDGGFLLAVPEGAHELHLRYADPGFAPGVVLASLAAVLFLAGMLIRRRRERAQPDEVGG